MAASPPTTLDQLWKTLGLDSLPGDAGTAVGLDSTRVRDWAQATIPGSPRRFDQTERVDLPRLTLTPPRVGTDAAPETERDLVVIGMLGEGGMARVLLAHQTSLGREVAVKIARPNAAPGTISALVHEAQITGALEHPAVIPVYSMGSDAGGHPALVMKRVEGVAWSELLANAEHPIWQLLAPAIEDRLEANVQILRQVCNAIAFAHRKGVIHRDLKPANVLIGEFGEVYVADWGIAIRKTHSAADFGLVGTPVYLAPEMVSGNDALMDERTDVFLLGAILYQLLSGAPPWSGPDLRAVLEQALACRPRPVPADAPAELQGICARAMSLTPVLRYATALEFRDALGNFLHHRGSVKLSKAADQRLHTLLASLPNAGRENVYALLSECRFGFTQALIEWPQNEGARQGLGRCLEATARHELDQGNLGAARALLKELGRPPPELIERVAALAQKQAATEHQKEVLARLTQEMIRRSRFASGCWPSVRSRSGAASSSARRGWCRRSRPL
jgi:eukaryotic-like serine/threonine-protein kinase